MSTDWVQLLAGAIVFGSALVLSMVAGRRLHFLMLAFSMAGLVVAVIAFGSLSSRMGTPEVVALAIFFLLAGIVGGYWVSAAGLPLLAHGESVRPLRTAAESTLDARTAVVLLVCAEPSRYDARSLASRQRLLVESDALTLPATAAPFVFLSEKTRYRAIGGTLQAESLAHTLAEQLAGRLGTDEGFGPVAVAWCGRPPRLSDVVARLYEEGHRDVVVAPLGSMASLPAGHARNGVESLRVADAGMQVTFSASVWESDDLADRLVARITTVTRNIDPQSVGVALIGEGEPPAWALTHPHRGEEENYFAQRVRLHLTEAGLDDNHIRVGWLDWQLPDVTETVRHLAALGCSRIVVVPGMIPLPSLATEIDLHHSIRMANLSEAVSVITLSTWEDDATMVDVLTRAVRETQH